VPLLLVGTKLRRILGDKSVAMVISHKTSAAGHDGMK
jgi:hypothetical protein